MTDRAPRLPLGDASPAGPEHRVPCGFTIVVDSREQDPYLFHGLRANADRGGALLDVPTTRIGLPTGDYAILGLPGCVVERKSLSDLFASVSRRENFEGRLGRMNERAYAAVVVEAEWLEILRSPPPFSRYNPKALARTVMAWTQRYVNVHWWFMPGRAAGEATTFRLLEMYHRNHKDEMAGT